MATSRKAQGLISLFECQPMNKKRKPHDRQLPFSIGYEYFQA